VRGSLFLLFFAANYQPWTSRSRRNPGRRRFGERKNSEALAVLPLFSTDLFDKATGVRKGDAIAANNSTAPLDEICMPVTYHEARRMSISQILF
jgi:hypothetical protein